MIATRDATIEKVIGGIEVALDVIERAAKNYLTIAPVASMEILERMADAVVLLGRAAAELTDEAGILPEGSLRLVR